MVPAHPEPLDRCRWAALKLPYGGNQLGRSFTGDDQANSGSFRRAVSLLPRRGQCSPRGCLESSGPHRVRARSARRPRRTRADVRGLRHRHGREWLHERGGLRVLHAAGLPGVLGPSGKPDRLRDADPGLFRQHAAMATLRRVLRRTGAVDLPAMRARVVTRHHAAVL